MTTTATRPILLALAVALTAGGGTAAADVTRERHETHPLRAGGSVSLENVNGDVTIEAWDRQEVSVRARLRADDEDDLDGVQIHISPSEGHVAIDTEYQHGRWGGWGCCDRHVSVDYHLKVPRNARLRGIELVNGDLDIVGVAGDVEASLVNGDLDARGLTGNARLETVNGTLKVAPTALGAGQRLELSSVNGGIELGLPEGADAEFDAQTVHGRIRSDVGEVHKSRWVGSSLDARVGGGAARVELETVNGSIEVRRSGR